MSDRFTGLKKVKVLGFDWYYVFLNGQQISQAPSEFGAIRQLDSVIRKSNQTK